VRRRCRGSRFRGAGSPPHHTAPTGERHWESACRHGPLGARATHWRSPRIRAPRWSAWRRHRERRAVGRRRGGARVPGRPLTPRGEGVRGRAAGARMGRLQGVAARSEPVPVLHPWKRAATHRGAISASSSEPLTARAAAEKRGSATPGTACRGSVGEAVSRSPTAPGAAVRRSHCTTGPWCWCAGPAGAAHELDEDDVAGPEDVGGLADGGRARPREGESHPLRVARAPPGGSR